MDMGLICAGMHDGSASVWFALPSDILNARLRSGHDGASVQDCEDLGRVLAVKDKSDFHAPANAETCDPQALLAGWRRCLRRDL